MYKLTPTDPIKWLLEGDISIRFQTQRDLLENKDESLQDRIKKEGWAYQILSRRNKSGHWGEQFYQPKWISTHYTILDLRNLWIAPSNSEVRDSIHLVLDAGKSIDGGIPLGPSTQHYSDVCVNAMFLNYASYFQIEENKLTSLIDAILNEIMPDGAFNCRSARSGAVHSSLHTTISVLEGLFEFVKAGFHHREDEISNAINSSVEFILLHKLYMSDHTGATIHKGFLKLSYPSRWKYDILRALDFFQYAEIPWDERMRPALDILLSKQNKHGTWNMQAAHPGQVHIKMEQAGKASRINTLRVLRVLKQYQKNI